MGCRCFLIIDNPHIYGSISNICEHKLYTSIGLEGNYFEGNVKNLSSIAVKDVIHYFLFRAVSPVTGDGM
jgi:hypothetical protein